MKKIVLLLLVSLIIATPVAAVVDNNAVMLRDDGTTTGTSGNGVRKTNKALLDVVKSLFSGSASNSSSIDRSSNATTGSTPTDGSTIDPNINTTATDITSLLNNTGVTYPESLTAAAQVCLKNISVYKQVQQSQGIPWQVLAGIHYREGGCNSNQSPVGGRVIGQPEPDVKSCSSQENGLGKPKALRQGGCGFDNLLDATTYAAIHLKGKIGGVPQTHAQLVSALSKFNGGGNSNCRGGTPYTKCPPTGEGFDDAYVFNKNPGEQPMFLRFCADGVKCNPPREFSGIGVIPIAGAINQLAKES